MEENIMSKLRQWTDAIATEKIAGIIPELKELLGTIFPEKTRNQLLFKLLQHLSHAAYKYDRSKIKLGSELTRMTHLVCSNMKSVSNAKKFFSSVYHIVVCLLEMSLYSEGIEICDYLLPEYGLCRADETVTRLDIFEPTSALWHRTAANFLKNTDLSIRKNYDLFIIIVEYELYLTKLMFEKSWRDVVARILSYSKRIILKNDASLSERFKDFIVNYVGRSDITLNDDDSDDTWQLICELMPVLIGKDINFTSVGTIAKNYTRYFEAFRRSIMSNKKYRDSFAFWERLCVILLRSVQNLNQDCVDDIDRWIKEFNDRLSSKNHKVLKSYCYAILQLLTSIMNYWEECAKRKETMEYVTSDVILAILKLSKEHGALYGNFEITNCRCEMANCGVVTDIGNELVLKIKCLSLISRRPSSLTSETVRDIASCIVETSVKLFETMKMANCRQWCLLWPPWGAAVYNMGVTCENTFATESMQFYTRLFESIVILEGVKTQKRLWGFDDPLGTILHRLSSVCLRNQRYDRARSVAAINGLLSHDIVDSKAYRDWTNIKHKDSTERDVTMLRYLRSNEPEIPQVRLEDYDLVKVCLREIKALQESQLNFSTSIMSVIDEMERLNPKPLDYAQGVQLLGYHALNFSTNCSIKMYLRRATLMYEGEPLPCMYLCCAYAMIKFFEFVERTREMSRKTESEMKMATFALTSSVKNSETNGRNVCDVVPAYSAINMTITSDLQSCLKQAFARWRKFVDSDCRKSSDDWQIRYTLHCIKIAGEYASLYHFEGLENEAWSMIYKLANEISDGISVIYATSRSLASTNFRLDWINETNGHVARLVNSEDRETTEIIARYRLCLANFYYENGEIAMADELFLRATREPEIRFMHDMANFLIAKEIEMKHRLGRNENDDQSSYTSIVIQCLYTILSMDDAADTTIYGRKEKQLNDCEILLDFTNNLSIRMNSLLSYREISAHLAKRLCTAQKLISTIRVAECLKCLCYIDLSRAKLDDCEVKLQGLEHILEIEAFDVTMRSKLSPCRDYKQQPTNQASYLNVDAVRDVGQSDASPVLRKKVFAKPDFMLHGDDCSCLKCTNTRYQYLIFACTHIRAQLFALQRNSGAAFQHFHGAMRIKKSILTKQEAARINEKNNKFSPSCPQRQREAIEYVMFHLDYCRFLVWSMPTSSNSVIGEIAQDALELCEKYNLRNHPVYMSVNEFIFQRRFGKLFTKDDYSRFMVPDINEMNVDNYEHVSPHDPGICVTPVREIIEKRPISVRRRKTPPFLKLDRVPIDLADDDTTTKKLSNFSTTTKTRRLRRKICEDDDYSEEDQDERTEQSGKSSVPKIEIISPVTEIASFNDSSRVGSSEKNHNEKFDDIGEINSRLAKSKIIDDTRHETRGRTRKKGRRVFVAGDVEKSSVKSMKNIDEVIELFDEMKMEKNREYNCLEISSASIKSGSVSENSVSVSSRKISSASSVLSSDVATSSENEEGSSTGRRGSARLRKKKENPIERGISKNSEVTSVSEPKSDDEIAVADTRSVRRLYTTKDQNMAVTRKIVKKK